MIMRGVFSSSTWPPSVIPSESLALSEAERLEESLNINSKRGLDSARHDIL